MSSKLVFISALVCLVAAASGNGGRVSQAQAHKLKVRQTELDSDLHDVTFFEDPVFATIEHGLIVPHTIEEVLVDSEGHAAAFQLEPSHPDFKGPYHYEKPHVDVKTGNPDVDYLPPHAGLRDDSQVKRSVKLHARRH